MAQSTVTKRLLWVAAAALAGTLAYTNIDILQETNSEESQNNRLIAQANVSTFIPTSGTDGLPREKEGDFPIQMPTYNGVKGLLHLSDRYVIVATSNIDEVCDEIGRLAKSIPGWPANADFVNLQRTFKQSLGQGKPNWDIKRKLIDPAAKKYFGQARLNVGEKRLDDPSYYAITSTDDERYKLPLPAANVTRFMGSIEGEWYPGIDPTYLLYSYLELPAAMEEGKTYTIALGNGKSVTFKYDEFSLVSRAIKVNQVGYLPEAKKYAYLGCYLQDLGPLEVPVGTSFSVVNAHTGASVHDGTVALRAENPRFDPKPGEDPTKLAPLVAGENIYELDFSDVRDPGTYFIRVTGVGRSWPFTINNNAYAEAFYTQVRGLYHQRCGIAIGQPYTPWPRIKCHDTPVFECKTIPIFFQPLQESSKDWNEQNMVAGSMDKGQSTPNATGGWHDAGDWDKRIQHYTCIMDLLNLFELKPQTFADRQLNIPESGNGIPDILDEAEYGLLVWKKSMKNGGVAGLLDTNGRPTINDPNFSYYYSLRTRWASLLYAAAAAQYAGLVRPFNGQKAAEYEASAKEAYVWGTDPKNSLGTITVRANRERERKPPIDITFTENEDFNKPFLIAAKMRLFALTNEKKYIDGLEELLKGVETPFAFTGADGVSANITLLPGEWPFSLRDCSPWLYSGILHPTVSPILPAPVVNAWRHQYLQKADELAALNEHEFYRRSRAKSEDAKMKWGFDTMTNHARFLLYAHHLTNDEKYKEAALLNIDYMLGGNPMGMSWTTGIGFAYPVPIHHSVSQNDGIPDPVPGLAIYGPNEMSLRHFSNLWLPKDPNGVPIQMLKPAQYVTDEAGQLAVDLPRLRNWAAHPFWRAEMNEFTIWETMSGAVFSYGYLLDEGWEAPQWLKERKPRDPRVLFGWYYLP